MKAKKLLCMALCLVMVFALCACGSDNAAESKTEPAAETAGETAEPAADKTGESGDAAASDGVFKLGVCGPLTGGGAIYGNAVLAAAQIAVDELNAAGGVQFEVQGQDDEADGEKAVNAYNNLLDWGMQVLVGPVTTGAAITVSSQANTDRVFCLTPSASSTDVIDGKDNVFQVCFTDPNQGSASADYMAENFADSKIAVIYKNDDAYSQGIRDSFVSECSAKGLEVVYEGTFTTDTATDFSVQLTAAQTAGADLLFLPIYYTPAATILSQAHDMNYAPTFFGVDGMDGILTLEGFDTSLAEGVMLLTPFSADAQDEKTQAFVAEYTSRCEDVPNQFAADAYDAVYIVAEALEKAGCTPDMSPEEICEALVQVMPEMSFDGLTGAGMTWDANGAVSKAPMAVVIENGQYVLP